MSENTSSVIIIVLFILVVSSLVIASSHAYTFSYDINEYGTKIKTFNNDEVIINDRLNLNNNLMSENILFIDIVNNNLNYIPQITCNSDIYIHINECVNNE